MKDTTPLARAVFVALIMATIGAFFVTQRLKRTPPIVQSVQRTKFFSPNGDGTRDVAKLSFKLKKDDDVTVAIVDHDGDLVRTLVDSRAASKGLRVSFRWDGRGDDGRLVEDGVYRPRIGLRRQGRSVTVPTAIYLDTKPPRPIVVAGRADRRAAPLILPARGLRVMVVRFSGPARGGPGPERLPPRYTLYRTDLRRPRAVLELDGRRRSHTLRWNLLINGRAPAPGVYMWGVRVYDRAGNIGTAPPALPPRRGAVKGRAGFVVRPLAVRAPLEPVLAGARFEVNVDSRGGPYRWQMRRVGSPGARSDGVKTKPRLRIKAPAGESGLYLLELTRRTARGVERASAPIAVQARASRGAHKVLVVLPSLNWLGATPFDDDGDGVPDTLDRGGAVPLGRPFGTLPAGVAPVAKVLITLDRQGLRYDLTTDRALAATPPPDLGRYTGIMLAGDERWLPALVGRRLRRFANRGGDVLSLGTGSLRRTVTLTAKALTKPSAPATRDIFGSRIRALRRLDSPAEIDVLADNLGLFAGTGGSFPGFTLIEETASVPGGQPPASAAGPGGTDFPAEDPSFGKPVIVGYRLGAPKEGVDRGIVMRAGLPEFAARLGDSPALAELLRHMWSELGT